MSQGEGGGRPTIFTEELAKKICDELKKGCTLVEICSREDMPDRSTVFDWRDTKPKFSSAVARARKKYAESRAEDNIRLMKELEEHVRNCPNDVAASQKLRAISDAIKTCAGINQWQAEKFGWKQFGVHQRQDVKTKGEFRIDVANTEELRNKLFSALTKKVDG